MAALLFFCNAVVSAGINQFEKRCLWVVRNTLTSPQSIDEMLTFADINGFNHLLVQVRGRGDAYYDSKLVPRSELLLDPDFDPLEYIIEKAHNRGIEVHAWVNAYFIWAAEKRPRALHHVYNSRPNWLDSNGFATVNKQQNNNGKKYFLAPHHPDVNNHLLTVFRELTALYEIDGLHLDYIRFRDAEYGNNEDAKTHFYKSKYKNQEKIFEDDESVVWDDFRRAAVTNLVKETKAMLLEVRPDCKLSAAVKPNLRLAHNRFYQEWDVWLAAGYLDWVMPMNYTPDIHDFAENIDLIYDQLPKKYRDRIIMGIALYNQDELSASDKIKYSKITRFKGISLFSYNVFLENQNYMNQLIINP
ncbi:MAG TPA: family 10 glycosylhydrolase [Candidatus Marinimicrobia bacterium]|nr:hypothetical protein [Candidatus Neomarinimicrobiota bacterium]HBN45781.1 hypothetical protein [Candidatus Neomarinimicrobiota bacterium]HJL75181.1 family 10 glycosylhydrolase [Candidatus Neomarinimicrobiota bacterium]HJM70476.1 family 10 glycosylhydrolase [Candidatus Neomarinimicrobiota bacterium]